MAVLRVKGVGEPGYAALGATRLCNSAPVLNPPCRATPIDLLGATQIGGLEVSKWWILAEVAVIHR